MGSPLRRRMIRSSEAAALARRYRLYAWYAAGRDARRRIRLDTDNNGWAVDTAFVAQIRAAAAEAEQRLLRVLCEDHGRLVVELHTLAAAVVHHEDVLGEHNTVHHKRFRAGLWTFATTVMVTAPAVHEVMAVAERLSMGYWTELRDRYQVVERHGGARPSRPRPAPIVPAVAWSRPAALIPELLPPNRLAEPRSVFDRAVRIVAVPMPP